ncbi:hypothetical protein WAK64_05210 [Bacillus spongiae]|uniref:Uncharacterized protein n=1 Tax=Bacillus spongiae TaxID=2683610 RepID=A0ABU8HAY0_9BACI
MNGVVFGFFALSIVLFFGTFHYLLASQKPGMYPPKNIVKKRAVLLGSAGAIVFVIGLILWLFSK